MNVLMSSERVALATLRLRWHTEQTTVTVSTSGGGA
jgi:hypothetical protein